MQWFHPIGGEYGDFNHKLRALSLRIWKPLAYQFSETTTDSASSTHRVVPETVSELVENLSLLSQRAFSEQVHERRLCRISESGLFDLVERGS